MRWRRPGSACRSLRPRVARSVPSKRTDPAVGSEAGGEHAGDGALAGAGVADQADVLPGLDADAHVPHRVDHRLAARRGTSCAGRRPRAASRSPARDPGVAVVHPPSPPPARCRLPPRVKYCPGRPQVPGSGGSGRQCSGAAGDDGDQRGQDDGVVARVDAGEDGQVVGHRAGAGAGLRLGPGVDDLQPGGRRPGPAARRRRRGGGRRASTAAGRRPGRPR